MSRTASALLALPLLLALAPVAGAQDPGCAPGYGPSFFPGHPHGGCAHHSYGGFCFRLFSKIHFHGPLFNYGPYSGYYPFEPYGPWNSQLQYTGPLGEQCSCGHCGACRGRLRDLLGGLGHGDGCHGGKCGGWGHYAKATLGNVFHRTHPGCKGKDCFAAESAVSEPAAGCVGCAAAAAATISPAPTGVQTVGAEAPALPPARRER